MNQSIHKQNVGRKIKTGTSLLKLPYFLLEVGEGLKGDEVMGM